MKFMRRTSWTTKTNEARPVKETFLRHRLFSTRFAENTVENVQKPVLMCTRRVNKSASDVFCEFELDHYTRKQLLGFPVLGVQSGPS